MLTRPAFEDAAAACPKEAIQLALVPLQQLRDALENSCCTFECKVAL